MTMEKIHKIINENLANGKNTKITFVNSKAQNEFLGNVTFTPDGIEVESDDDKFIDMVSSGASQSVYKTTKDTISYNREQLPYKYTVDYITNFLLTMKGILAKKVE